MKATRAVRHSALFLLLACALPARADLRQCAGIADDAARLACYDALAAPAPAASTVAPAPAADDFGKPRSKTISARIVGSFKEWRRGTLIKLDNGQVWQTVNDETRYYPNIPDNAEVVITEGMFGFAMTIVAIERRVAVKRVS